MQASINLEIINCKIEWQMYTLVILQYFRTCLISMNSYFCTISCYELCREYFLRIPVPRILLYHVFIPCFTLLYWCCSYICKKRVDSENHRHSKYTLLRWCTQGRKLTQILASPEYNFSIYLLYGYIDFLFKLASPSQADGQATISNSNVLYRKRVE